MRATNELRRFRARALGALSVVALLVGCGPQARATGVDHPPAPVPAPAPTPAQPAAMPEARTAELDFHEHSCTLRARDGVVSATECSGPSLRCAETGRAELAPFPGEERIWRCFEADAPEAVRGVAVAAGDAVLWALSTFRAEIGARSLDCSECLEAVSVSAVDVVPDAERELWVHVVGCGSTQMQDVDALYKWREGRLVLVAESGVECQFTGDTSESDAPEPPASERYACEGGYLDLGRPGAVQVLRLPASVLASGERGADGRLIFPSPPTREALRWDPGSFRFGSAQP